METLFLAENIHISLDPETQIMFCQWVGAQTADLIRQCGQIMLDLIKKYRIEKVLNDHSEVTGPWIEAADWIANHWFPEVILAGVKHFAWVLPRNIFSEISALESIPASDVVCTFYSIEEAQRWLVSNSKKY